MDCKYLYNGEVINSYLGLLDLLSGENLETLISIVYSLSQDAEIKLDQIRLDIENVKKEFSFKRNSSLMDEDLDIDTKDFTTQTFIDSAVFTVNGEAPIFKKNDVEWLDQVKKSLIDKKGYSEEEADFKCALIKSKETNIANAAYDLHRILLSRNSIQELQEDLKDTAFKGMEESIYDLSDLIRYSILKSRKDSAVVTNIGLEAQLKGLAEKIVGHIDYLIIRPDGDLEIYNIKASIDNYDDWLNIKKEKYKYQLALIKRILESKGINVKNIRLNLVPVKLTFDENYTKVLEVSREDPKVMDIRDNKYIFQHYDNIASLFIDVNPNIDDIEDEDLEKVNTLLQGIIPSTTIDLKAHGIRQSIELYINRNWKSIAVPATNKKGWDITLPDMDTFYVEDSNVGSKNAEVMDIARQRSELLINSLSTEKFTYRLVLDIKESIRQNRTFISTNLKQASLLVNQLSKYFKLDDNGEYEWKLVESDTLNRAGILLFKNGSNQLDVVTISAQDLGIKVALKKGRNHILAHHLYNLNSEGFNMTSNYNNIEAVRTMTLLNHIVPKLGSVKLGTLKIISTNTHAAKKASETELSLLLPQFDIISNVVNKTHKDLIPNNFKKNNVRTIDPVQLVIQSWLEALKENPTTFKVLEDHISGKTLVDGSTLDGLETAQSIEGKLEKLQLIADKLESMLLESGFESRIDKLHQLLKSENPTARLLTNMYLTVIRAINLYYGDLSLENEHFGSLQQNISKPLSINNSNIKVVAKMFQRSVDTIADTMLNRYNPIKNIIMLYYKDCGYTSALNRIIGNKSSIFSNLYVHDSEIFRFKNPYDLSEDLKDYERTFLKDILWELNKVRWEMLDREWTFSGKDDPQILEAIASKNYLNVPLERASNATRRVNIKNGYRVWARNLWKKVTSPKESFSEFTEGILSPEEHDFRDENFEKLSSYNPFTASECSINTRLNLYKSKGFEYFETDVENIMIDFLEKHIQSVEYNKMLVRTKGVLLDLYLKANTGDNEKDIEKTIDYIYKFLSVSVYNKSIMEDDGKVLDNYLKPLRLAVSKCYIALNPTGAVRDIIQGVKENLIRSITKFLTDINPKDIAFGYKEIMTDGVLDPMKLTKYNQLNLKYRISNLDVARISEGLKTGTSGLINWENWMYSTLRGPDYLNRMVLFVARLHHDGVHKAYYTDSEGKLVYDYKLDKRFAEYVNNNTQHPDYYKQRSLYLSLLRMFNQEKGLQLVEGDPLPDAYTQQQVDGFKQFADNIYGAYDQSKKWMWEHCAIGRNMTPFITWMNGIVDVYWKKTLLSSSETLFVQETDESGNLLYFDEYFNVKTLEEGGNENLKVMKNVPIMVQGVLQTLHDVVLEINSYDSFKEGWTNAIKMVQNNSVYRRNINRIRTDIIVILVHAVLYNLVINPAYKEHKKKSDGDNFIINAMIELLYKGAAKSNDTFLGPLAVLDYVGNSTNPASYKFVNTKIIKDGYNLLFGDKSVTQYLIGIQAFPRAFSDTYQMWVRDNKE